MNYREPLTKTTALHVACTFGHSLIVKALLADKRVRLDLDGNKMTALQTACLFSRPACVKQFLELWPKITGGYNAAFKAACRSGSAECAVLLANQEETKVHDDTTPRESDSDEGFQEVEASGIFLACSEGGHEA